ncbi:MAG: DUF2750 domain-containing protein [Saprospiraceae bacterium]|nr:DUF2750 domain-containing protein [Saprospiraceae bacterium]
MELTKKNIDEILARKPESRYKYFIRTAASEEEVWGLADEEGWLMLEDDTDNSDVLAVFPNPEFAEIFQEAGAFGEFQVEALDLYEFLEWMEDMEAQKIKVGVFPTPDFQCAVMTPDRLLADFQAEFDKETE